VGGKKEKELLCSQRGGGLFLWAEPASKHITICENARRRKILTVFIYFIGVVEEVGLGGKTKSLLELWDERKPGKMRINNGDF